MTFNLKPKIVSWPCSTPTPILTHNQSYYPALIQPNVQYPSPSSPLVDDIDKYINYTTDDFMEELADNKEKQLEESSNYVKLGINNWFNTCKSSYSQQEIDNMMIHSSEEDTKSPFTDDWSTYDSKSDISYEDLSEKSGSDDEDNTKIYSDNEDNYIYF